MKKLKGYYQSLEERSMKEDLTKKTSNEIYDQSCK